METLPTRELTSFRPHSTTGTFSFVQFDLPQSSRATKIRLNQPTNAGVWIDGNSIIASPRNEVVHVDGQARTVTIALERERLEGDLQVELVD